ncbi:cytochrome p450 [Moniliophthora roreri MCA 2997]|uniref:Cytochrome p450 n=2 Tax=Moniliophthora roreri TaxID=221103 RepID=V2YVE7_MONRO|nr:cytochrome p450 [Moniliophthora roreri MCA 2997]KAI3621146.1 cytochrome p450 [Moniliophthora roreri]
MAILVVLLSGTIAYVFYKHLKGLWDVDFLPGLRPLFAPLHPLSQIVPNSSWSYNAEWAWIKRKTSYMNFSRDIISVVPLVAGAPCYYTCSIDVMKQILGNEAKLNPVKPLELTLFRLLGNSLPSVSGDIWRRHRRVVAPAFGTKVLNSAWQDAIDVYGQMMQDEGWEKEDEIVLPESHSLVLKVTLLVLAKSGFGMPTSWTRPADGLDIIRSLSTVSETFLARIILPRWAYSLPFKRLHSIEKAWNEVTAFINTGINERKAERREEDVDVADLPGDLLNRLVVASEDGGRYAMTKEETVANMLSLLFAGHETTASGLLTTLGYLALYQDEQQAAYNEIQKLQSVPLPQDLARLQYVLGCFLEAQRLCPAPLFLPRDMPDDIPVKIARPAEETFVLKKGYRLVFDMVGIMRNPHFFEDPDVFRPSRWIDKSESELGMFGFGPRMCVGRKFAQYEAVAWLACLLRDWRLDIALQPGETKVQYIDRVMGDAGMIGTAFALRSGVPLKLVRRKL